MASSTQQQFRDILAKREKEDKKGITKDEVYTALSVAPITGEAIAVKELPDDIKQIKKLFEEGYRESDFKKLGMGALYTTAVTAGLLPIAGPLGRAGKTAIKSGLDKVKPLFDKQTEMMQGFPPSGPDALATANNVPVKSIDETDKLLDKANINKPIDTSIPPSIKPDEYLNAPKINPTMSGMNTPTGKLQGRRFLDLEGKGNITPEKLFEQTQVYRGQDGKLRWEIDTTDAKLKFDDTLDMRRGNYQLSNILDFDRLYKEYYKDIGAGYVALRNLKVRVRGVGDSEGTLGSYNRDLDRITLNMKAINVQAAKDAKELGIPLNDAINLQVESTLLHEVQHAVQAREGFTRGSNLDNFLRKGFTKDYEANATLQDSILFRLSNDLKDGLDYMTDNRKLGFLSDIEVRSKRINEIENLPASTKTDAIKKEYMDLTALRARDLEQVDLPKAIKKKVFTNFNKAMDENARQKKLLDKEELVAYGKYRDVYGEKEARLVQKRFEDRYAMSKMAGKDIARDEVKRDTKFLNDSDGLGKMGGFNKGGTTMNMNKQMEMFDEGGLKEEGGTIDPVSGNDVPIGSTQEEVRDDIPAQLSEGEFVFPADVVRFIGLEKLMMMRQEAKAGLKRMEEMGQMGNADEATMPDDMPFDINDIDMEDEREYNKGGVVEAATGTFVNQGTNVTSVPSQFAGMNLPSFNPNINTTTPVTYNVPTIPSNVSGYTPKFTGQTGQSSTTGTPSFQTLIGDNPGRYDEMREYKNDAGQTLNIPFKNGQPIYPIPEGYSYVDPEAIKTDDPTTEAPITDTTRVTESQDSNDNDNNLEGDLGGARTTIGGIEYAIQYNLDGTVGLQSIENYKATGKRDFQTASTDIANAVKNQTLGQIVQLGKIAGLGGLAVAEIVKKATGIDVIPSKIEELINSGEDASEKLKNTNLADVYDMGKAYLDKEYEDREGKGLTGQGLEGLTERQMREMQAQMQFGKGTEGSRFDKRKATSIKIQARKDFKAKQEAEKKAKEEAIREDERKRAAARIAANRAAQEKAESENRVTGREAGMSMGDDGNSGQSDDNASSGGSQSGDTGLGSEGYSTAVGGFIPRLKKKPKTKKMKRGGLASR